MGISLSSRSACRRRSNLPGPNGSFQRRLSAVHFKKTMSRGIVVASVVALVVVAVPGIVPGQFVTTEASAEDKVEQTVEKKVEKENKVGPKEKTDRGRLVSF